MAFCSCGATVRVGSNKSAPSDRVGRDKCCGFIIGQDNESWEGPDTAFRVIWKVIDQEDRRLGPKASEANISHHYIRRESITGTKQKTRESCRSVN